MSKEIIVTNRKPILYLKDYLAKFGVLPDEAVILGVVNDGLPYLFNSESKQSPNIVIWNMLKGQGLRILKVVSEYIFKHRNNDVVDTEFLVITQSPSDWEGLAEVGMGVNGKTSCIGVVPFYSDLVDQLIASLVAWIEDRKGSRKPILVLVDGLEYINALDPDTRRNFMHILMYGRKRNVYVISTTHTQNGAQVDRWLDYFQLNIQAGKDAWFETKDDGNPLIFFTPETEI